MLDINLLIYRSPPQNVVRDNRLEPTSQLIFQHSGNQDLHAHDIEATSFSANLLSISEGTTTYTLADRAQCETLCNAQYGAQACFCSSGCAHWCRVGCGYDQATFAAQCESMCCGGGCGCGGGGCQTSCNFGGSRIGIF
eukprot:g64162.t1